MVKTPLEIYLTKVALGDASYLKQLHARLSGRLCYVPVVTMREEDEGKPCHKTHVQAYSEATEGKKKVLAFTSPDKMHAWLEKSSNKLEFIEVLGGDLCTVLSDGIGVVVDAGAENSVELSPTSVKEVAAVVESEDEDSGFEPTETVISLSSESTLATESHHNESLSTLHDEERGSSEQTAIIERRASGKRSLAALLRGT